MSEELSPLAICLGQIKGALPRATGAKNPDYQCHGVGGSVHRTIAPTIAATVFTTAAVAQNRPSTTAMTCQQAASLVYARGAIVLGTGGYTYDRFVRDRSFCQVPRLWRAPGCRHGIRRPALSDTGAMSRAEMTCSR